MNEPDCGECHHSHYDHIGWRREGDLKTYCRIIRCECKGHTLARTQDIEEYKLYWPTGQTIIK